MRSGRGALSNCEPPLPYCDPKQVKATRLDANGREHDEYMQGTRTRTHSALRFCDMPEAGAAAPRRRDL